MINILIEGRYIYRIKVDRKVMISSFSKNENEVKMLSKFYLKWPGKKLFYTIDESSFIFVGEEIFCCFLKRTSDQYMFLVNRLYDGEVFFNCLIPDDDAVFFRSERNSGEVELHLRASGETWIFDAHLKEISKRQPCLRRNFDSFSISREGRDSDPLIFELPSGLIAFPGCTRNYICLVNRRYCLFFVYEADGGSGLIKNVILFDSHRKNFRKLNSEIFQEMQTDSCSGWLTESLCWFVKPLYQGSRKKVNFFCYVFDFKSLEFKCYLLMDDVDSWFILLRSDSMSFSLFSSSEKIHEFKFLKVESKVIESCEVDSGQMHERKFPYS